MQSICQICINTSIYIFRCKNDILCISLTYLSFVFICQDGYFHTNAFCVKFLNNFSLPDVAFPVMPLVHIMSLVVCVSVAVPEHDEPNKVDFVLLSICGEFTQTLQWYSIIDYILLSFSYHIYLSYVFIYMHIAFTYLSIFFHMSRWIFWHTCILYEVFQ